VGQGLGPAVEPEASWLYRIWIRMRLETTPACGSTDWRHGSEAPRRLRIEISRIGRADSPPVAIGLFGCGAVRLGRGQGGAILVFVGRPALADKRGGKANWVFSHDRRIGDVAQLEATDVNRPTLEKRRERRVDGVARSSADSM